MKLCTRLSISLIFFFVVSCGSTSPDEDGGATDLVHDDGGASDNSAAPDSDALDCQASCSPDVCAPDDCGAPCPACENLPAIYGTSCQINGSPDPPSAISTVLAFPNLFFEHPVYATHAGDGSDRVFVVEKRGRIKVFDNQEQTQAGEVTLFLDITNKVNSEPNEAGLLSVAFHPEYETSGRFFVNYTRTLNGQLQTVISSFLASASNPDQADPNSEQILLTIDQPYGNHNGGQIEFGHDGYLYIGMGDGGWAGDPLGAGQDTFQLLAKMLRINVDTAQGYTIPADNPFAQNPSAGHPEIWAWGLRNPWRFSFDRLTGQLWAGDVGQDAYEEVHIVEAGKNYGWNIMEGSHCYSPSINCDDTGLEQPVVEYDHSFGESITGGYVYRGSQYPELFGAYIYGDYVSGRVFAARFEDEEQATVTQLAHTNHYISSFGEDEAGELFLVDYPYFTPTQGRLYRLVPQNRATAATSNFPLSLSETGCFSDLSSATPALGVVPYSVNASLWHDGATSERFFVLPDGGTITAKTPGAWSFPDGSILIKTFYFTDTAGEKTRVETRFEVKDGDDYRFYSYQWNEDQSDAILLSGADERDFQVGQSTTSWHYPSRSQCSSCHTEAAGGVLGPHTGQMNKTVHYGEVSANQLYALQQLGAVQDIGEDPPAYPDPHDQSAPLSERARAALFANCAGCHQPGGSPNTSLDLRYETALNDTLTCNVEPEKGDSGVSGAKIITPGQAGASTLWLRMVSLTDDRMPNLGSFVVDVDTTGLIEEWINSLSGCE